jgi:WD40 repeat protein
MWDPLTGTAVPAPFACHASLIAVVSRPSDGDWLACATDQGPVRVFDAVTGTEHGPGFHPIHRVARLATLRGAAGRVLVVTGDDKHDQVRVGDPATGQRLAAFGEVYPERMLAVPRTDGTDALLTTDAAAGVTLWDPLTGAELTERLAGHAATVPDHDEVLVARLSGPDDQPVLITGGSDGTLRRWNLPPL